LLLLEYTGVLDAEEVIATWWSIVLVLAGLLSVTANPRHWIGPALIVGLGGALLLRTTGVVDTLDVVGPALLVLLGVAVIFGKGFTQRSVATQDRISSFNVFSGSELA
jgi:hypothetical protein